MDYGIVENGSARLATPQEIESHVAALKNAEQEVERTYSYSAIRSWPDTDLAALGVYPIRVETAIVGRYQRKDEYTYTLEGSEIVRRTQIADMTAEQVIAAKPGLKDRADEQAEAERAQYVTTIWGQETVYLEKEAEAKAYTAWDALGDPPPTPYLTAEVAATRLEPLEDEQEEAAAREAAMQALVALVMANSAAWRTLSVQIEAKRMRIKAQIDAAVTADDLRAVEW